MLHVCGDAPASYTAGGLMMPLTPAAAAAAGALGPIHLHGDMRVYDTIKVKHVL